MANQKKIMWRADAATRQEEHRESKGVHFLSIYKGARIPWLYYLAGIVVSVVTSYISAEQPKYLTTINMGNFEDMTVVVIWTALRIAYIAICFGYVLRTFGDVQIVHQVRSALWGKVIRLPMHYYDKESPSRIVSRVTSDTEVAAAPFQMLVGLTGTISLFVSVWRNLRMMDPTLTWWYFASNIFIAIYTIVVSRIARKVGFIVNNRLSKFTAHLSERLVNFDLIKASGSEEEELEKGYEIIQVRYFGALYNVLSSILSSLAATLSVCMVIVVAFGGGAILLERGVIKSGTVMVSFYMYGVFLGGAISAVLMDIITIAGMFGSANKVAALFEAKSEDTLSGSPIDVPDQDIVLKDVSFSYNESQPVLEHVDCVIPKGKVTAIVGANGTGKSTMAKLLERLYPANDGQILFGDADTSDISLKAWRGMFSMVTQEANLFSGTIRQNVCYGLDRPVKDEELAKLAVMAGIEELISSLPEGWDTEIGVSGSKLSGGERQRIAIARAIMKNSDYLVLDEATANLDARTEQAVKQGLANLMEGRTTIMIAHNLSAIREADQIIVLENGHVSASGTHDELMTASPYYREFVTVQQIEAGV